MAVHSIKITISALLTRTIRTHLTTGGGERNGQHSIPMASNEYIKTFQMFHSVRLECHRDLPAQFFLFYTFIF